MRSAPDLVDTAASRNRSVASSSPPGSRGVVSSNGSFESIATPLKLFCPWTFTLYPSASKGSRGNASSTHLVSWKHAMSGARSLSQATTLSTRCLIEFTFQVATRMAGGNQGLMTDERPTMPQIGARRKPVSQHGTCLNFADAGLRLDMLMAVPKINAHSCKII